MLSTSNLVFEMQDKTLALTYDDGPGPHTLEIAEFLNQQNIRATFFVVGKHVRERREVVEKVAMLGHLIGNHTDTHPSLTDPTFEPAQLTHEVLEADRQIQQFTSNRQLFLRTPGGEWPPNFAEALIRNDDLRKYSGPVNWDIDGGDYEIGWTRNRDPAKPPYTLELCLAEYLQKIRNAEKGKRIVLLHDWSADPGDLGERLRGNNRTFALTQLLVSQLTDFRFVTLDQVATSG
jgi:peptidoglycan/xylan/chitin deacetylase (PgdA/CDA1 family)